MPKWRQVCISFRADSMSKNDKTRVVDTCVVMSTQYSKNTNAQVQASLYVLPGCLDAKGCQDKRRGHVCNKMFTLQSRKQMPKEKASLYILVGMT